MAYIFLQGAIDMQDLPRVRAGLCNHIVCDGPPAGQWMGPFVWRTWAVDWMGRPGIHWHDHTYKGVRIPPYRRPDHSWHIYRPNVAYRHMNEVKNDRVLGAWFFFTVREKLPLLTEPTHVLLDPSERLVAYVRHMYELQQAGRPGDALVRDALALTFVSEVLAAAQRGGCGTPADPWRMGFSDQDKNPPSLLALVDEAVEKRLGDALTIDDVAEALRMSLSSLAHRFKAETGMTVMERVRWLRIREARRLLVQPDATVKAVARELSFCSPFHLSKLFKEITGSTPQEWMQRNRA